MQNITFQYIDVLLITTMSYIYIYNFSELYVKRFTTWRWTSVTFPEVNRDK